MFLDMPHRTTRNYKALLKAVGTDIFNLNHCLEPYYVAGYAHYRLEFLFRNQQMAAELKPARYHLLFAFRLLYSADPLPPMNSRKMKQYATELMEVLWDDKQCRALFADAETHVRAVADGNLHRDNIRTEAFTTILKARLVQ